MRYAGDRPLRAKLITRILLVAGITSVVAVAVPGSAHAAEMPLFQAINAPQDAGDGTLVNAVSCVSTTFCMSVGSTITDAEADFYATRADVYDGRSWTDIATPTVPDASSAELLGVSCTSTTSCIAVGYWWENSVGTHQALIESYDGHSWTIDATSDVEGDYASQLSAISCVDGTCTAVGWAFDGDSTDWANEAEDFRPLVETYHGTTWNYQFVPNYSSNWDSYLLSVSCTSPSFCAAVGFTEPFSEHDQIGDLQTLSQGGGGGPLTEEWNGTNWKVDQSADAGGEALYSVSCASSRFCEAVGGGAEDNTGPYGGGSDEQRPSAETYNGSSWTSARPPVPHDEGLVPVDGALFTVDCPAVETCTASGDYVVNWPGPETWDLLNDAFDNGTWTAYTAPDTSNDFYAPLFASSCVSVSACVAVGDVGTQTPQGGTNVLDNLSEVVTLAVATGRFVPPPAPDTVTVTINADPDANGSAVAGEGTVTSTPSGIDCPGTCTAPFPAGTNVTLHEVADSQSVADNTDGCSSTAVGAYYPALDCTDFVDGDEGEYFDAEFTHFGADLQTEEGSGSDPSFVNDDLDACNSSGADPKLSTYTFTVDSDAPVTSAAGQCDYQQPLFVGPHTASVTVTTGSGAGQRTATASIQIQAVPISAYSWTVDQVPYGTDLSTAKTTVHFTSCESAGWLHFVWNIKGSGIPDKTTTSCDYTVKLRVNRTYQTTLTVDGPNGTSATTATGVNVPGEYAAPTSCDNFSTGPNACWRIGLNWFSSAFDNIVHSVAGALIPSRPPDYAVVALSAGDGLGVGATATLTCDGNEFVGDGLSLGTPGVLPFTAVLGYGYVGNVGPDEPTDADIDSFASGVSYTGSISLIGRGFNVVSSTDAEGNRTTGYEYVGGYTGPGLSISYNYAQQIAPIITPAAGEVCSNGVTASPVWQEISNQQTQPAGGAPTLAPLSGSSPQTLAGITVDVTTPPGTFAPGAAVTVSVHSKLRNIAELAATDKGQLGHRVRLPGSLAVGVHHVILTGLAPNGHSVKTIVDAVPIISRNAGHGLWVTSKRGSVTGFGSTRLAHSRHATKVQGQVASIASSADGRGYWLATTTGRVFAFGDANSYHRVRKTRLHGRVIGIAATPDGRGYLLATSTGQVVAYGDAVTGKPRPGQGKPHGITAISCMPDGGGYWLTNTSGQIYAFGAATKPAAANTHKVTGHVVSIASTPDGLGYWLATANGHVFAFGDAATYKSTHGHVTGRVIGVTPTFDGRGYWLTNSHGTITSYGDAEHYRRDIGPKAGNTTTAVAIT